MRFGSKLPFSLFLGFPLRKFQGKPPAPFFYLNSGVGVYVTEGVVFN